MTIEADRIDRIRDALTPANADEACMTHLASFAVAACDGALSAADGTPAAKPGWRRNQTRGLSPSAGAGR